MSILLYIFTGRVTKLTAVMLEASIHIKCYPISSPYVDKITGDHQCGFQSNRSTTDQIFCIRQLLGKNLEYNDTIRQLLADFKKDYDSVRRKVLYNILIQFGVPLKPVRLIKMCLNKTYTKGPINIRLIYFLSSMV
jgi:hypothetical protein